MFLSNAQHARGFHKDEQSEASFSESFRRIGRTSADIATGRRLITY